MSQFRSANALGLCACLVVPMTLQSQSTGAVELFGAVNNSFAIPQMIGGLGFGVGTRTIGVRASVGAGFGSAGSSTASTPAANADTWAADVDVVVGGLGGVSGVGGAFNPYGFAGIGAQSGSSRAGYSRAVKTWSYGGGILIPLGAALSLRAEARYRSMLGAAQSGSDFTTGQEYRAGLVLGFGGSRGRYRGATRGPVTSPIPGSTAGRRIPGVAGAASRVVASGEDYLGVPYLWGGTTPRGFDCSGFVQFVYRDHGVELPRTSRQMAGAGQSVSPQLRYLVEGDLMLFAQNGTISHVAIYAGNGQIIHSSSSGNGVRYDDLATSRGRWFAEHMVAARRVASDGPAFVNAFLARANIAFDHFDPPDTAPRVKKPSSKSP